MPSPPSRPGLHWTTRTLRPDRRIDQRHRRGQPVGLFPVREGRDKSQPQTAQIGLLLRPQRAASYIFPSSHGFVIVRLRNRRQCASRYLGLPRSRSDALREALRRPSRHRQQPHLDGEDHDQRRQGGQRGNGAARTWDSPPLATARDIALAVQRTGGGTAER